VSAGRENRYSRCVPKMYIYIFLDIYTTYIHTYINRYVYISPDRHVCFGFACSHVCICACVYTGHEDRYSRCVPKMVNRVPDLSISTQNFAHTSVHTHALVMPLAHPRNTPFCTRFISSSYFPRTHTHSHISLHTQTHTQTPLSLTHAYIHTLR